MHRQSIGSPAPKLHSHGVLVAGAGSGNVVTRDDINNFTSQVIQNHDDEYKSQTPHQQNLKSSSSSSKLIHLIPILTFFCFLVLYLSSHDPSRKDLAQFSRFATISTKKIAIDSTDVDDFARQFLKIQKSDVLVHQRLKNLQQQQQQEVNKRRRLHRKFEHQYLLVSSPSVELGTA